MHWTPLTLPLTASGSKNHPPLWARWVELMQLHLYYSDSSLPSAQQCSDDDAFLVASIQCCNRVGS